MAFTAIGKKTVFKLAKTRVHPDLLKFLKRRDFQIIEIVPPQNKPGQEAIINLLHEQLKQIGFAPQNGDVVAVLGVGESAHWIGLKEAVEAIMKGKPPYMLFPLLGGKGAQYNCLLGEQSVSLPV